MSDSGRSLFVLRPDAIETHRSEGVRVRSPVVKRSLKTTPGLLWLLEQFRTPRTIASVIPHDTDRVGGMEKALRSAVRRLLEWGVLVEVLWPSREELGRWLVSDVAPEDVDRYDQALGQWHTVEVGSRPLAEVIASRSEWRNRARRNIRETGTPAFSENRSSSGESGDDGPLLACRRPDGRALLLGAAERARRAWASAERTAALLLSPEDWLARAVEASDDFFGTQRGGIPYQSIVHEGSVLVEGRRPDMVDRMLRLRKEDIAGKRVLDFGCNIGMNCQLAHARGASETTGIDSSLDLVRAALRLNCYFGTRSNFFTHDLEKDLEREVVGDTALCFALIGHLRNVDGVKVALRRAGVRVFYVETHCEAQSQGAIDDLLASDWVRKIEFLGRTRDNIVRQESTRKLYRCEVL